jgi:protein-S-isoprenylcysteine O-methyltransferase Ste14
MNPTLHDWLGLWPYAVVIIVVASWMVYRFLAPTSWREWAGAGLLQAFIIALYAEMYGFPLTIYFLTAVLGIEVPNAHWSGHLWSTLLGYGPDGALVEMALGMGFLVAGMLLIIKGWVRIYSSDRRLQSNGVYALVRHPQYGGIFLVIVGQLVHWPTMLTLILAPAIVLVYVHLAYREEAGLIARFGDEYRDYQSRVPMFVPRWRDVRTAIEAM